MSEINKSENDRVKQIRTSTELSQKNFAEKMGLSRDVISNIENYRTDVKEYVRKAICKEYAINYLWLKSGIGEPKTEIFDAMFDEIKVEYDLNDEDIDVMIEYVNLKKQKRKHLLSYIKALINTAKEEED